MVACGLPLKKSPSCDRVSPVMKEQDVYKGFRVLSVSELKDFNSRVFWLRHEASGLEVLKLSNDDRENSFAFAFRTPCENSTGVAHAIEHSVLCGSQAYPLKDPFIRLENQSVSTYLNAYTCPDHTVYPSSSPVKADFYNIFSVYADAVFFPLLREGVFLQECHRLELDKDGNPSIQGVVYNEMKGNYASFEDVAYDAICRPVLEGSEYVFDSGGDPLVIPSLSYEAFRDYHRRYYCTANCLCYLYGDIPLEEELDFLIEHVTSRVASPGQKASYPAADFSRPVKRRVQAFAPAGEGGEESRRVAAVNWRLKDDVQGESLAAVKMEFGFLSELLWGDDSAPVSKKLLAAKIGTDIAPYTGFSFNSRYPSICFSMSGVAAGDEEKFRSLLFDALQEVVDRGVSKEDFDRTAMCFDFSNREIKRPDGTPFSLVLMRRAVKNWLFGFPPDEGLSLRDVFEKLRHQMQENPRLISGLIEQYLLQNDRCTLVTVDPSDSWERERAEQEQALAEGELALLGKERVLAGLKLMQDFQQSEDDESCLPHLHLADLPRELETIRMDEETLNGVPFFVSREATNGITYFDLAFPFDILEPEDYPYITTLVSLVSQVGCGGIPWDKMMARIGAVSGGFAAQARSFTTDDESRRTKAGSPYLERDIFFFRFKCLDEQFSENLDILSAYLEGMDFSDEQRITDLLAANANDIKASVLPDAHLYAMSRTLRMRSPKLAVRELLSGISNVSAVCRMQELDVHELALRLEAIYQKILAGGALIHVTAGESQIPRIRSVLSLFIDRHGLTAIAPCPPVDEARFARLVRLTEFDGEAGGTADGGASGASGVSGAPAESRAEGSPVIEEIFTIPGSVAFDAKTCASSPYGTKESLADEVFSRCLSMTDLWDKVRTRGGAYGVFFLPNSLWKSSSFITYRDPKPFTSLAALSDSLQEEGAEVFSDDEVEKSITGCYTSAIAPKTPSSRGYTGFFWLFTGGSNEDVQRRVRMLLDVNREDLRQACLRYRESFRKDSATVIICPRKLIDAKSRKSTGKIIALPV